MLASDSNRTLAYQFERHAARIPEHIFLRYEARHYTYAQANALINRHAHAYRAWGVERGDVVALAMDNRPEYLWHLLGLHKIGAVASLINTHIRDEALAHAIRVCDPKRVVVGAEIWQPFSRLQPELGVGQGCIEVDVEQGGAVPTGVAAFGARLLHASEVDPPESARQHLDDLAAYIYTSGTTGLPKAALVRHERFFRAGAVWSTLALRLREHDVLYNCLPLYHSNGLLIATGSVITAGATMALARRFSRSRFWQDVREHGATSFVYIGELCRYLINAPASPADRDHRLRIMTGNGLRADIWREFQRRFGVPYVAEFYGATEGNCVTLNILNIAGSVGPMLPSMVLARWDEERQDFVRDERGHLVKARPGEAGILLGKIRGRRTAFHGYRDAKATESKVLRDAFRDGDAYFNTGDLMRSNHVRMLFFVDRVGDTFRWKGENVSTTEVQEQLSRFPATAEASVYGVRVPGAEGRAGMASIVLANGAPFDPAAFKSHVDGALPAYARPLFVRVTDRLETTGTFKHKKNELQTQGYDPGVVADPLFFRDPASGEYVPLDVGLFKRIEAGEHGL